MDQYVLGKQYSSIASGVSGYQSIMQQEIVDTEGIDFALTNKSNVDVETFVQTMDTDELIAYMDYTLGMTLEESINTVNNTDADVRLKYIQNKASEKLKKDYRLKMGLKERAVTDADRQFASAIGRPLPEDQKTLFTRKGGDDRLLQYPSAETPGKLSDWQVKALQRIPEYNKTIEFVTTINDTESDLTPIEKSEKIAQELNRSTEGKNYITGDQFLLQSPEGEGLNSAERSNFLRKQGMSPFNVYNASDQNDFINVVDPVDLFNELLYKKGFTNDAINYIEQDYSQHKE